MTGCGRTRAGETPKSAAPAAVSHAVKETELTTVRLTAQAAERLGIETRAVELQTVNETQIWPGELVIPSGRILTIDAPFAGTVTAGTGQTWPVPGEAVRAGQIVAHLRPAFHNHGKQEVLSAGERLSSLKLRADLAAARAEADGEAGRLQVQVEAARIKANRAKELLDENVGSQRSLDEAGAELASAEASLHAAGERQSVLKGIEEQLLPEGIATFDIASPIDGMLRDVQAGAGEAVAAGTPLFVVMNFDRLWVRVPVYTGAQERVAGAARAQVSRMNDGLHSSRRDGVRVAAPPTAAAAADTVDVYFEIDNSDHTFRPGERVQVTIDVSTAAGRPVVPWSAVVHDIDGGTWTYVNDEPNTYFRTRVEIERVVDELAVLRRGPSPGTPVVISGVAELYGTEFGIGK